MSNPKRIISCAITGAIHTPSMSPHLPVTAMEIADSAVEAAAAGAAIVHLHARDPVDGRPSQSPELFDPFLRSIRERSDVIVNITTGGSPTMTIEERLLPSCRFRPEIASLNMGSMNFGMYPMVDRYKNFKYAWEQPFIEGSRSRVFRNTFADIEQILATCAGNGTRFEVECYDAGHLYTLAHFADRGLIQPPFFIQTAFGILGGIGQHPEDIVHMRRTADRLFGSDSYVWSILAAGRNQISLATMAATMGANVRVGLEDSLWLDKGVLAPSNAAQVARMAGILESLGLAIATPSDARELLALKGAANVNF